jgi:AcrR family transcriptional regulator
MSTPPVAPPPGGTTLDTENSHARPAASSRSGPSVTTPRGRSTRDRVLDVVLAMLEEGGEVAVRIDEVRDRSGVSIGSLYHHFGDRDGLIVAAQVRRFARFAEAEIAALSDIVERSEDVDQFRRAIRQLTLHSASQLRTAERWARVAVLASSVGRPELAEEVRAIQTRLTDEFQAHVAQGQARGFFRSDLDPRAVALFVEAYSLGLVLNELDERPVSEQSWEKVVWSVIDALIAEG